MARRYVSAAALGLAAPTRLTEGCPESEAPPGKVALLNNKNFNSPSTVPTSAAARKPWLNLQARYLLQKFHASLLDGDDGKPLLVVSRWALCKSFTDLAVAEAWLKRVGGPDA